jgi:type IX secretion system PorP/SprF family membrane protein
MKRNSTFFAVFYFIVTACVAQQRPHYTQYVSNSYIINPAIAGIENYTDVKISHRNQWLGLEGAPVTTYVTIHGPSKKEAYGRTSVTGYEANGENPRGKAYWHEYTKAEPHSGLGFTMINDRTGPLNRFAAYGTYAYHIGLTAQTSIGAGISAGFQNMTLNTNKLLFDEALDPAIAGNGYLNRISPDINAGIYLYSANYFAGISAQQLVPSKLRWTEDSVKLAGGKLLPHLFFTAGYKAFLSDDVTILPSVLVKYINPAPTSVDLNVKVQYRDLMWLGGSYRHKDGFAAMVGVNVNNTFNVGYSYDITTTRVNTVSRGTHEILLGFLLNNRYGDWCPRNIW